jgi:hypothetical protein
MITLWQLSYVKSRVIEIKKLLRFMRTFLIWKGMYLQDDLSLSVE